MGEDLDPFDWVLAEALGMTVEQIQDMSNREYLSWRAFYTYRQAMRDLEAQRGK